MLRPARILLPLSLLLALAACHSHGNYGAPNPVLGHGPGVVEWPDPVRAYVPVYLRYALEPGSSAPATTQPGGYRFQLSRPHGGALHVEPLDADPRHRKWAVRPAPPPPPGARLPRAPRPPTEMTAPPAGEADWRGPRRVRRAPGQPLGVEFVE